MKIIFVWENLGPSHFDRVRAFRNCAEIDASAIEFFASSATYDWERGNQDDLRCQTLLPGVERSGFFALCARLLKALWREKPDAVFLCHYHEPAVFLASVALRIAGTPVFAMIDSKFDDKPRSLWREALKAMLLAPYHGAIAGSRRTAEYLRFLGLRGRPVVLSYNCLDVARLRALAGVADRAVAHADRDFLAVARLVPEKNLDLALRSFALWQKDAVHPRRLRILGGGPHEAMLRVRAAKLGIAGQVSFEGHADARTVAEAMRDSLALVFPSIQETFGFVVIEALAQGLPVLVSPAPGAVDGLIDNGINGWIVAPDRPEIMVAAMSLLDRNEAAWRQATAAARISARRGDVAHFVAGVRALVCGR